MTKTDHRVDVDGLTPAEHRLASSWTAEERAAVHGHFDGAAADIREAIAYVNDLRAQRDGT